MRGKIFGYLEDDGHGLHLGHGLARHEEWSEAILPADADAAPFESTATTRRPLVMFGGVVAVVAALLGLRLFALQLVGGEHNLALADGNRTRSVVTRAPRGEIMDRHGTVLAANEASFDVTVIPRQLPKAAAARQTEYQIIAGILGDMPAQVQAKAEVTCGGKPATALCLDTSVPQLVAPGVERSKGLLLDQASADLPGFSLDINPIRRYADGDLLSVFLGYTGRANAEEAKNRDYGPTDLIGKLGLEKQYENVLRGTNGASQAEVDASGKTVRVLASREPSPGDNLKLSVDLALQQKLAGAIKGQMDAAHAQRASGVAMDPRTGEILAAVSLPTYDNNAFSKGISTEAYQKLVADPGQPLFNKVAAGAFPSGSIIKPIGAAAALQEKIVSTSTTINDTGKIVVPNKYEPDKPSVYLGWERTTGLGPVNVVTALARSSDIFFYEVMGGFVDFPHFLGVNKLTDYYKKFGLGVKTGVDLPSESAGRVPTPDWKKAYSGDDWFTGDTYNISVGQGDILVSPLQMVTALSAIANGGTVFKPHFVTQEVSADGTSIKDLKPEVVRSNIASAATLSAVRQGMLAAVNDANGTSCCRIKAEVPVAVAAKTGTAETVVHDAGTDANLQSRPHSWFEAFAPYDNPQIAIVVLIEHAGEGAEYAAPAARETLAWYFTQGDGSHR